MYLALVRTRVPIDSAWADNHTVGNIACLIRADKGQIANSYGVFAVLNILRTRPKDATLCAAALCCTFLLNILLSN